MLGGVLNYTRKEYEKTESKKLDKGSIEEP
jgi:hypothetical protein